MAIEEEMSKCILYNLSILGYVVPQSDQLKEFLTEGLFLRTNTNAFIQVTYYLFNIIDSKEFKKKFYWPIIDKRSENSYRTNSVEFINMLIEKYSLSQDKIKQVTVVHPSGKKFMSLIMSIISVAIKEVMKRKKISSGISLDIDKAEKVVGTISEIENQIMSSMKAEVKTIKEKTTEIQELISSIYPSDENSIPFDEFIENWHALNQTRLASLKEKDEKVKEIFTKTNLLQQKAQRMLSSKKYEFVQPSDNQIKELAEFYQHLELPIDKQLNIVSLLLYLESALPIIQNYIKNFSYDEVDISQEEMKIVKRKLAELQHFEPLIKKLMEKEKVLKEKITKLRTEKDELSIDHASMQDEDDKILKEAQGKEELRTLLSPKYSFDASRNCMNSIHLKRNLFSHTDSDGASNMDHSIAILNQSKLYRSLSDQNLNKSREMAPPKQVNQQNKPPSRRRRRDPMQLMEQAISSTNKNKFDLNATGAMLKTSTPFSSTMLSPDLIHHANINFSMISDISSVTQTPLAAQPHKPFPSKIFSANLAAAHVVQKPDVLDAKGTEEVTLCAGDFVKIQDGFERKPLNIIETVAVKYNSSPVKLQLNDETICNSNSSTFMSPSEDTVCEKENFGSEVVMDTIMFLRKPGGDEDLFNISDTVLVEND